MLAAWENLALPLPLETPLRHAFVKTFQMDLPQPAIPLMFSAALQRDVSACHEEWMRIARSRHGTTRFCIGQRNDRTLLSAVADDGVVAL